MRNRVAPPPPDLAKIRQTRARLEELLDRVRASQNPLDPALLRDLRDFLERNALPAALDYEHILNRATRFLPAGDSG